MTFSWPWHFISVSEEEKLRRRELLDLRGTLAQMSILVVIITLRVYYTWATAHFPGDIPKTRRRSTSWWDRPLIAGWIETRRQYLLCGIWLSWLLSLSVWRSGDDYLHLTKALNHIALSQVPLQILMSPAAYITTTRPSAASIFSFITSIPQATLTPYHRLFGRVVVLPLFFGHASLYLLFFAQSSHPQFGSLLAKRVRDFDVQCGLLALAAAMLLLVFVRPRGVARKSGMSIQVRRRSFYFGHVFLVTVLCAAAYWHVAQAQKYMLQALGASIINGVCAVVVVRWG